MKKMRKGNHVLNIVEFIMTQNMWEYYVTDDRDGSVALCLVHGFETEIGFVCLDEISPYIIVRTNELTMQPAIGWVWE
jgi:hypothetical protein